MVAIMVAITFGVAILINIILVKRLAYAEAQKLVKVKEAQRENKSPLESARNLMFHHGHTWVKLIRAVATIGLDDFAKQLIGSIDKIEVPPVGTKIEKGKKLWSIKFGDRELTQLSPISGTILEINDKVVKDPSLLTSNPKDSWLVKVVPYSFTDEVLELQTPSQMQKWTDFQKARFLREYVPNLALVYGDGGEIVKGAALQIEKEKWEELAKKLFS